MKIRVFPGIVFGLLGLNMAIVGVTVYKANTDRSFAVVPDYYQKGLHWDVAAAQLKQNESLGWTAAIEIGSAGTLGQNVVLRLSDREGRPVDGAKVSLVGFHSARAVDQLSTTLMPAGQGRYHAEFPLERPGLWEFQVKAVTGTGTFTATLRRDVLAGERS